MVPAAPCYFTLLTAASRPASSSQVEDYAEAASCCARLEKILTTSNQPLDAKFYYRRSLVLIGQGDLAAAWDDLGASARLNPTDAAIIRKRKELKAYVNNFCFY